MSYGVNSIQIHKKLRLDKRAGSDNWYARLTLPSGKRLIKTTKTEDVESAKEVALRLYYEVDARIQNKLPATTRKFGDVAKHAIKAAIVNVTSIASSRVHPFAGAAYATSKAALAALTREMAHDYGPMGVRVNAIVPGEIETNILSEGTDEIVQNLALRRLGQPYEIADAIHFLCSDASSYITGTEVHISGGQHI